jgi:hypothetical protein
MYHDISFFVVKLVSRDYRALISMFLEISRPEGKSSDLVSHLFTMSASSSRATPVGSNSSGQEPASPVSSFNWGEVNKASEPREVELPASDLTKPEEIPYMLLRKEAIAAKESGLATKNCGGNGDCGPRAIAHALWALGWSREPDFVKGAQMLRAELYRHWNTLGRLEEQAGPSITIRQSMVTSISTWAGVELKFHTAEEFIKRMRKDTTFFEEVTMQAVCDCRQIRIVVKTVSAQGEYTKTYSPRDTARPSRAVIRLICLADTHFVLRVLAVEGGGVATSEPGAAAGAGGRGTVAAVVEGATDMAAGRVAAEAATTSGAGG